MLRTERLLNGRPRASSHPAWGEDVKVMGVRCEAAVSLTIACAMIGRYLADLDVPGRDGDDPARDSKDLAAECGFDMAGYT